MPVALITGASRGLGRAVATALDQRGWQLIITARGSNALTRTGTTLQPNALVLPGDVAEAGHRAQLAAAVAATGRLDLLVNNASTLGPSPLPALDSLTSDDLAWILNVNTIAPQALTRALLPDLSAAGGTVINVSSDAAVGAYPGWGGYGASKAALDLLTRVLAAEHPELAVFAFDPGDMRTDMHQAAFPGEDISDRPEPESVVPALMWLIEARPPSGRYTVHDASVLQ